MQDTQRAADAARHDADFVAVRQAQPATPTGTTQSAPQARPNQAGTRPGPSSALPLTPEAIALQALAGQPGFALGSPSAGSVFRRLPTAPGALPGRPDTWSPAGPRRPPGPNVDTLARVAIRPGPPPAVSDISANVDTAALTALGQPARPAANVDTTQSGRPAGVNVDTPARPAPPPSAAASANVDTARRAESAANVDTVRRPASVNVDTPRPGLAVIDEKMPQPVKVKAPPRRPTTPTIQKPKPRTEEEAAQARAADIARMHQEALTSETMLGAPSDDGKRKLETAQHYQKRGANFLRRYRQQNRIPEHSVIDPCDFASWFLSMRPSLSPSTWRLYKQAALVVVQSMPDQESAGRATSMIEGESRWDVQMDGELAAKRQSDPTRRTSQNKQKSFPLEDYERVVAYITRNLWSKKADTVVAWLRAMIATGVRPDEWAKTDVVFHEDIAHPKGGRTYLYVLNAKYGDGRASGKTRTIEITDCTDGSIQAIMFMSDRGRAWAIDDRFKTEQSQAQQLLYRACRKLWPNRKTKFYALYSCRHQFVLNMRALEVSEEEVSAMLGHLVTETQMAHYGNRAKGWDKLRILDRPRGTPEEMAGIKRTITYAEDRARLDALINLRQNRKAPPPSSGENLDGVTVQVQVEPDIGVEIIPAGERASV